MADDSTAAETAAQTEGTTTETSQTTETTTTEATGAGGKATVEGGGDGGKGKGDDAPKSWRDEVPEEYRDHAGRFASPGDLVKAHKDLRSQLSKAIFRPGKDAKPEDLAAFHRALGVPETADKYEVKLPSDLPEHVNGDEIKAALPSFLEVAHNAGATPEVVNAVVGWYAKTLADQDPATLSAARTVAELHSNRDKWADELRREWRGPEYDENVQIGAAALKEYGGDEAIEVIEQSGLGNHPAILRMMARLGREVGMAEHKFHAATDTDAVTSLREQIRELRTKRDEALSRHDHALAQDYDRKAMALYERIA